MYTRHTDPPQRPRPPRPGTFPLQTYVGSYSRLCTRRWGSPGRQEEEGRADLRPSRRAVPGGEGRPFSLFSVLTVLGYGCLTLKSDLKGPGTRPHCGPLDIKFSSRSTNRGGTFHPFGTEPRVKLIFRGPLPGPLDTTYTVLHGMRGDPTF